MQKFSMYKILQVRKTAVQDREDTFFLNSVGQWPFNQKYVE